MKRPLSSLGVVLLMGLAVAPTSDAFVIPSSSSFDVISEKDSSMRRTALHASYTATPTPLTTPTTFRPRHAAKDWWYNVQSLPQSTVLKEIRPPVLCMATWALVVSCLYKWLPTLSRVLSVSPLAHSFLGSSLSLLLVFRTNSAYQRFQEGRKIWEDILTTARNFTRLLLLYRHEIGASRVHRMRHLMAAFPDLLRHHVQSGCLCPTDKDGESIPLEYQVTLMQEAMNHDDYESEDETTAPVVIPQCTVDRRDLPWSLLPDRTLQQIANCPDNRPLWICHRLGAEIGSIPPTQLDSRERFQLLAHVDAWTKAIGQCERIHNTATPVHYARHALRGLSLWLGTLPLCLVKEVGWWTAPTTALIAWLLFGVYQIGHSIEDPFQGSLRLSTLCRAIRQDVLRQDRWMDYDIDNDNVLEDSLDSLSHTMKAHRQSIFVSKQPEQATIATTLVPRETLSAVGAPQ